MSKIYGRLISIHQSLEDVTFILNQSDFKITQSIEDKIVKPANYYQDMTKQHQNQQDISIDFFHNP